MHVGNPVLNIQIGGNGAWTTRLYTFVECALFLQSLFQQNKANVSFREIARLIARNSYGNGRNVHLWHFLWPKCQWPKRPRPKCPRPKCPTFTGTPT